jgi:hypothetical protein
VNETERLIVPRSDQFMEKSPAELTITQGLQRFRAKHVLGLDPRMDAGSREENASKQNHRASLLIPSEARTGFGRVSRARCGTT